MEDTTRIMQTIVEVDADGKLVAIKRGYEVGVAEGNFAVPSAPADGRMVWDFDTETWAFDEDALAADLRAERDGLLAASDPMALPDYPHADEAARQAWLDYRAALRDVPAQPGFPSSVTWPEAP